MPCGEKGSTDGSEGRTKPGDRDTPGFDSRTARRGNDEAYAKGGGDWQARRGRPVGIALIRRRKSGRKSMRKCDDKDVASLADGDVAGFPIQSEEKLVSRLSHRGVPNRKMKGKASRHSGDEGPSKVLLGFI